MDNPNRSSILFCFAVKEEAGPFHKRMGVRPDVRIMVTGMGQANAARSIRAALGRSKPRLVVTSGFAGGLDPGLSVGTVLFDADEGFPLSSCLLENGAKPVRFHLAKQVASTVAEKTKLRATTGADAVEMESSVIRTICREQGIPSATVRVISDAAHEDLPLDFNRLLTPNQEMNYLKLIWIAAKSPKTLGQLWRFGGQVRSASERLAQVLVRVAEAAGSIPS